MESVYFKQEKSIPPEMSSFTCLGISKPPKLAKIKTSPNNNLVPYLNGLPNKKYRLFMCSLVIPYDEWSSLFLKLGVYEYAADRLKPKHFRNGITDYLTLCAQNHGICCWFRCHDNWFRCTDSTWIGTFSCFIKDCPVTYKLVSNKIEDNKDVVINVFASRLPMHCQQTATILPLQPPPAANNLLTSVSWAPTITKMSSVVKQERIEEEEGPEKTMDENGSMNTRHEFVMNDSGMIEKRVISSSQDDDNEEGGNQHFIGTSNPVVQNQQPQQLKPKRKRIRTTISAILLANREKMKEQSSQEQQQQHDQSYQDEKEETKPSLSAVSTPIEWTCEETCAFAERLVGVELADKFRTQDIDGRALDYLKVETLMDVLGIKLGCAARIKFEFERLKKSSFIT